MRVAYYIRSRADTKVGEDAASARQLSELHAWVEANHHQLVAVFEDRGSAAGAYRPALQGLIAAAVSPHRPYDAICVTTHSRLFRDAHQYSAFVEQLHRASVKLLAINDTQSDEDVALLTSAIAKLVDGLISTPSNTTRADPGERDE